MRYAEIHHPAPALETDVWINTQKPLVLSELKGKVVVIHAFQMLCPGCVIHSIPQAKTIYDVYSREHVEVIGLHTVFEHHDVMTINALKAFAEEYKIPYPIAVDTPSESNPIPRTMAKYQMRGTPTLIILDKDSNIRLNHFGRMNDMQVGSIISSLLAERNSVLLSSENNESVKPISSGKCDDTACFI